MPVARSLLDLMGDPRRPVPAPPGNPEYYRGSMPEYVRPNQDRNAMHPNDLMTYRMWQQWHGLPQERWYDLPPERS